MKVPILMMTRYNQLTLLKKSYRIINWILINYKACSPRKSNKNHMIDKTSNNSLKGEIYL